MNLIKNMIYDIIKMYKNFFVERRNNMRILKVILFLIAAPLIGFLPAFVCVFMGSFILLIFGIVVSDLTGNVLLWILTICFGIYLVADMIGKIKK